MRSSFPVREFSLPIEKINTVFCSCEPEVPGCVACGAGSPRPKENPFRMNTAVISVKENELLNIRDREERSEAGAVANTESKIKVEEIIAAKQAAAAGIAKSNLAQGIKNKRLLSLERELEHLNDELAWYTKRIACCIAIRDGAALQDKNFDHKMLADLKALKLLEDE
jgi:hypothetical protein